MVGFSKFVQIVPGIWPSSSLFPTNDIVSPIAGNSADSTFNSGLVIRAKPSTVPPQSLAPSRESPAINARNAKAQ